MKKELNKKIIETKKPLPTCVPSTADMFNKIIMDNVPVSIITIDKEGFITSVNKYFKNYPRIADFHKHNIFTDEFFINNNLVEDYKELLRTGKTIRKDNVLEKGNHGEASDKYFRIIAVPFRDEDGNIAGAVSLASDNTETVVYRNRLLELNSSLEEKIVERTRDLDKANKDLNKTLELKSIFMADVSHEFRTSLTIMQCSLELLSRSCDGKKEDAELFQNIITEIKRVATMLTDLSLLTKTGSSETKKYFTKFDLNHSISTVCKELKVVADLKFVKIEHKNNDSSIEVLGNQEEIEKLLLNLIRNAINYNKDSGWIRVWAEDVNDGVYIRVEDSGIGIPDSEFENIFERFYRIDRSRTRNKHDSGLGLSICKHVAEMHGGHISVASKLGQGSIFTVYLPHNFLKENSV